jgi:hypothetical protein
MEPNPYESPNESVERQHSGKAFHSGGYGAWTVLLWVLAAMVAIALYDLLAMQLTVWMNRGVRP